MHHSAKISIYQPFFRDFRSIYYCYLDIYLYIFFFFQREREISLCHRHFKFLFAILLPGTFEIIQISVRFFGDFSSLFQVSFMFDLRSLGFFQDLEGKRAGEGRKRSFLRGVSPYSFEFFPASLKLFGILERIFRVYSFFISSFFFYKFPNFGRFSLFFYSW